jgi:hypothetical protein
MSDRNRFDERGANAASCLAMITTVGTVVGCLALKVSALKSGLTLFIIGFTVYATLSLLALALIRPLSNGSLIARRVILVLRTVIPYSIGTYLAGAFLLIIGGAAALLRLIF